MTHEIKLRHDFVDTVNQGRKLFEVRKNDRGYQTGDLIQFIPLDEDGDYMPDHPLARKTFEISYLLSGWGIKEDYVAFGIRQVRCGDPKDILIASLMEDVKEWKDKAQEAQLRACMECEKYADDPEECQKCPIKAIEKELSGK